MSANPPDTAKTRINSLVQTLAERFSIFLRPFQHDGLPARQPEAACNDAAWCDTDDMSGLDALDAAKESLCAHRLLKREPLGYTVLVGSVRHFGQRMEAFRHAGDSEEAVALMIVQWPLAEGIPDQQHIVFGTIPTYEGIVANETFQACFIPPFQRRKQNVGVGKKTRPRLSDIEQTDKIIAIVEAEIGDEHNVASAAREGLAVEAILRQQVHEPSA